MHRSFGVPVAICIIGLIFIGIGNTENPTKDEPKTTINEVVDSGTIVKVNESQDTKDNNEPTKGAKIKLNEPLKVVDDYGDSYLLTVEGIRVTDERNSVTEKKANEVIYLDYIYENTDFNSILDVNFSAFQLLDEHGNVLDTYPINDMNRMSKPAPEGGKVKASIAYGLPEKTKYVDVIFHRNYEEIGKVRIDIPVK